MVLEPVPAGDLHHRRAAAGSGASWITSARRSTRPGVPSARLKVGACRGAPRAEPDRGEDPLDRSGSISWFFGEKGSMRGRHRPAALAVEHRPRRTRGARRRRRRRGGRRGRGSPRPRGRSVRASSTPMWQRQTTVRPRRLGGPRQAGGLGVVEEDDVAWPHAAGESCRRLPPGSPRRARAPLRRAPRRRRRSPCRLLWRRLVSAKNSARSRRTTQRVSIPAPRT